MARLYFDRAHLGINRHSFRGAGITIYLHYPRTTIGRRFRAVFSLSLLSLFLFSPWFPLRTHTPFPPVSLFQELRFLRREILPDFTVAAWDARALCAHCAVPPRSEKLVSTRIADHRCVIRCARVVRSTWHVFDVPFLENGPRRWSTRRLVRTRERSGRRTSRGTSPQMQSNVWPSRKRHHYYMNYFSEIIYR